MLHTDGVLLGKYDIINKYINRSRQVACRGHVGCGKKEMAPLQNETTRFMLVL